MIPTILKVATFILPVAMFADGWTTNRVIKKGGYEADPIVVDFLRSNHPTPLRVYVTGGIVAAFEIGAALLIGHFNSDAGAVLGCLGLGQAAAHIVLAVHNYRLFK